jgi:hypothetical protein
MVVRIGHQGGSEGSLVIEEIPVASDISIYRQHHRTRKRANFPVVLHARELG